MSTPSEPHDRGPNIIGRADHNVSRKHMSRAALKVLYRLHESGYQAFLVGGAVRDLMLDGRPKDFDIATDADPDQVHELFRNSRVIGRRFRLVHVRFGREIIEVATFRAATDPDDGDSGTQTDNEGRLLRDNAYGSIDDDVWRRDFTANALYYNIADFTVWDYVNGADDVRDRRLQLIGEPARRLREDPVRVLRAVRFAAKLDFTLEPQLKTAIAEHKELLSNVPPARLFDEFLKMFQAGFAARAYEQLDRFDVFGELFPDAALGLDAPDGEYFAQFIRLALENTDRRVAEDKPITPMFLIAVFLWWPIKARARALFEDDGMSPTQSLGAATYDCLARQQSTISIPRRFTAPLREMLTLQPRFEKMAGGRALGFLEHRRFRAAYDFMLLRSEIGEVPAETAAFWTHVQTLETAERAAAFGLSEGGGQSSGSKRPRRRRRRAKSGAEGGND
ncbi:MAG: polynucleotide adenylyltransferase PcnB [Pseudomonadota bacterium]